MALVAQAVAHRVEARQVGERLAGAEHVIGADRRVDVRKLDLDELGAGGFKFGGRFQGALADFLCKAVRLHELLHDAYAHAGDILLAGGAEIGFHLLRCAVKLVVAADGVHDRRRILHAAREGPHLVERAAEGHHAVARNHAVGGLHADDAAEARGLADRPARVGAECDAG